jgi:hypothetical protein
MLVTPARLLLLTATHQLTTSESVTPHRAESVTDSVEPVGVPALAGGSIDFNFQLHVDFGFNVCFPHNFSAS